MLVTLGASSPRSSCERARALKCLTCPQHHLLSLHTHTQKGAEQTAHLKNVHFVIQNVNKELQRCTIITMAFSCIPIAHRRVKR